MYPSEPGMTTIAAGSETITLDGVTISKLVVSAIFTSCEINSY
jgi:hypothetical protein